jgi:hypothetical protein
LQVLPQPGRGGRVQRQQAGLAELALAHGHHAGGLVEVAGVQGDRLADPHAGDGQQPDQGRVGRRAEPTRQPGGSCEHGGDVAGGIQVGGGAVSLAGDEPRWRHLGGGVDGAQVGGEPAHGRQPHRPPPGRGVGRQGRPRQGVADGDRGGLALLQVGDELGQQLLGAFQLEPQRPADAQVVGHGLA